MDGNEPMRVDSIVDRLDNHDAWAMQRRLKIVSPMDASMLMLVVGLALKLPLLLDPINLVYVIVDVALILRLTSNVFHNSHRQQPNYTCTADRLARMDCSVINRTLQPWLNRIFVVHIGCNQLDTEYPITFADCVVKIGIQCSMDLCIWAQSFHRPMEF